MERLGAIPPPGRRGQACAAELGTPVEWGGDWRSLKDGPHFQLPRGRKAAA
ncbi:M15 family metallopeptidase [Achromobacter xylosoxidans]